MNDGQTGIADGRVFTRDSLIEYACNWDNPLTQEIFGLANSFGVNLIKEFKDRGWSNSRLAYVGTDQLKSLGEKVPIPSSYSPDILERIPNTAGEVVIQMPCTEWTGMCPKTRQPDFGTIYITYVPKLWLVESKSLKLYVGSFRQEGCFHEDVVARFHDDLVNLLEPTRIHIRGTFNARGGIPIYCIKASDIDQYGKRVTPSTEPGAVVHPWAYGASIDRNF